ncbi:phage tail protein [Longispora albida]|uniref:phage tail protein n=1 Tax=Longispora albida TaxID=203523 RepID=UPI000381EC3F|nr:hypothetical protein [Longispora albida]
MADKKAPGGVEASRVYVRVLPNVSDFAKALDRYLKRIEARTVLKIGTAVDPVQLAREVDRAVKLASTGPRVNIRTTFDVDAGPVAAEAKAAATVAEKAGRIKLPVSLDTAKLKAAVTKAAALFASAAKAGIAVSALAGMVSHAAALGPALAPALGALAALPALAAVAVAAIAPLKIAFSGVGDALKGDPEALSKLAPPARAFVGELLKARPALDAIKARVQSGVFGPISEEVQGLVKTWLPLLSRYLAGLGDEWGIVLGNAAIGAQSSEFIAGITAALEAARESVHAWGAAAIPIFKAAGQVIGAFAPAIGGAGIGLADAARRFAEFVNAAAESGKLVEFVSRVGDTLRSIGGILLQLGGIVGAVFSAAQSSGGGLLGTLQTVLTAVNAFLSAGEGKQALQDFFASTSAVASALLPVVQTLAAGVGSVLAPALASVARLLGPGLQAAATAIVGIVKSIVDSGALDALATGLTQGLQALGPSLPPIAAALGKIVVAAAPLLPLIGKLGAVLAGVLSTALVALEPLLTALVGAITSSGLIDVISEIGAELGPVVSELVAAVMPTVRALLPLLGPLVAALGKILVMVLAFLKPVLQLVGIWNTFAAAKILTPIVEALAKALGWIAEKADGAAKGFRLLGQWIASLNFAAAAEKFDQLIGKVLSWLGGLPERAVAAMSGLNARVQAWLLGVFVSFGQWVSDGVTGVLSWFWSLPGRAIAALLSLQERGRQFFAETWLKINTAVAAGVEQAVAWVRSLPGRAVDALSSLGEKVLGVFRGAGSWLVNAGRDIIQGLINGIQQQVSKLKAKLGEITDLLPSWKGPPAVDARILAPSGRLIMRGLIDGITGQVPALRAELQGVTRGIEREFALGVSRAAPAAVPPVTPGAYGLGAAGPVEPLAPVVNLTAEVRIGDGPVIDAVETAIRRDPARVARHVRAGERDLSRRG